MADLTLSSISDALADAVERIGGSVVQVSGRRRPMSGVVYAPEVVVTTARAVGREDAVHVRGRDGSRHPADVVGWDAATRLAVLRVAGLNAAPVTLAEGSSRPGHLAIAVARSWSNAVTATIGAVAVIGGPLPTGRGLSIPEIIRTSAPMHDGFAGGAFADSSGHLIGICTAAEIRGLGVVIPAATAWAAAKDLLEHGQRMRGYLGIAGQPVRLTARQRRDEGAETGVLIVGVSAASPAEAAGLLVGDVLVEFEGRPIQAPEQLLELLASDSVGKSASLVVVRGTDVERVTVTVGSRPQSERL